MVESFEKGVSIKYNPQVRNSVNLDSFYNFAI